MAWWVFAAQAAASIIGSKKSKTSKGGITDTSPMSAASWARSLQTTQRWHTLFDQQLRDLTARVTQETAVPHMERIAAHDIQEAQGKITKDKAQNVIAGDTMIPALGMVGKDMLTKGRGIDLQEVLKGYNAQKGLATPIASGMSSFARSEAGLQVGTEIQQAERKAIGWSNIARLMGAGQGFAESRDKSGSKGLGGFDVTDLFKDYSS